MAKRISKTPDPIKKRNLLYSGEGQPSEMVAIAEEFLRKGQMHDAIEDANQYGPSEPFTIVFNREPLSGDLAVDGTVDSNDLAELCYYWLSGNGSIHNDYYERADANRDEAVDFSDFALLAANWLKSID